MSFTGTVEHGVIKLPADTFIPNGTKVRVEPLTSFAAKLISKHGYLVATGPHQITWEETRKAMDELP